MADTVHIEDVEAQAALYALGALPKDEAALFEKRLQAGCPFCQSEVQDCQRAVAAMRIAAPEIAPPPGLRARLLESIAAPKPEPKPSTMGEGILVRAGEDWKRSPVPGVETRSLLGQKTMLVRMAPKTFFPAHDHSEGEQCLVIEGSITSDGVTAYAGDYTYMPPGSSHHPLYTDDGCVLLIAYS